MGKTSKPLTIVALPPCDEWEELAALEKQGHIIFRLRDSDPLALQYADGKFVCSLLIEADIILGPNCWRMSNAHKSYLTLALKEARMLKYQTHEKRADSKIRASIASDLDTESDKS